MNNIKEEIDLLTIIQRFWFNRRLIIKIIIPFFIAGVLIAFISSKEYTSTIVMVPQLGEDKKLSGLSSLASLAGVNLSGLGSDPALTPAIYPQIIESINFQKELMQTKVKFKDIEQPITLYNYYTNDEYRSLKEIIVKYTIGLPGVIISQFAKDTTAQTEIEFVTITKTEKDIAKLLREKIGFEIDLNTGSISLSASAKEPLVAAQLALSAQTLLQQHITTLKIEKTQTNLEFLKERYSEARKDYELKQQQLALFRDLNRNISTAISKTKEEILVSEYNLSFSIYSELAKQLEQVKLKVKDETPVFSIIQPAYVPIEKSKPNRLIIIAVVTFLGIIFSFGYILLLDFLKTFDKIKNNNTNA